jgi:beta-lactamase class D
LKYFLQSLVLTIVALSSATVANADVACTLVFRLEQETPVYQAGDRCDEEFAPASTFKLALALIGFETDLLHSSSAPIVEYDPALNAPYKSWRQATTPQSWLQYSVIWYSQWLTRQLGMEAFQSHVNLLNYGNRDLTGTPGRDDGLTRAWLSTSLVITPRQQSDFLVRFLSGELPYSTRAIELTLETAQKFVATDGVLLRGKTGNAWATNAAGDRLQEQHGWFVGWLEIEDADYVFVHLIVEDGRGPGFSSSRAKEQVLANIANWASMAPAK